MIKKNASIMLIFEEKIAGFKIDPDFLGQNQRIEEKSVFYFSILLEK